MGIHSVAVYSDIDRGALHTTVADEAYHLGPTPASESYLNIERLIDVAKRSGAEAVHPGYGFLAESAAFARAVTEAGLVWIGPHPEAIVGVGSKGGAAEAVHPGYGFLAESAAFARAVTEAGLVWIGPHPEAIVAMGSKVESRRIMARAGGPITPGTEEPVESPDAVLWFAAEHGFPVAVKASAGGGGKGFAVARDKTEAASAFERASREGEAYFGDGSVYVEKYLLGPRHIEIQVVRDKHGGAVHLGERDCSIQRRHQKLLAECPR